MGSSFCCRKDGESYGQFHEEWSRKKKRKHSLCLTLRLRQLGKFRGGSDTITNMIFYCLIYLHSKGFSITFAHSEHNPPRPSNYPDFEFLPLPDDSSDTGGSSGFIQFLQALNNNYKPHLEKHLIQMLDAQKEIYQKESIVIIHDNLMFCVGAIAGDLGLPSIIVRSSSAACVPAYRIIPRLHKEGRFPVEDSLLQENVPELHPLRYKDIPFIGLTAQQSL
ncbi:hypothetical protein LXL04_000552 [Taraxacum kok-saghyz]